MLELWEKEISKTKWMNLSKKSQEQWTETKLWLIIKKPGLFSTQCQPPQNEEWTWNSSTKPGQLGEDKIDTDLYCPTDTNK